MQGMSERENSGFSSGVERKGNFCDNVTAYTLFKTIKVGLI